MSIDIIPSEEEYNKNPVSTASWQHVYGRYVCSTCHQHFKPGDAYTSDNHGGFRHVDKAQCTDTADINLFFHRSVNPKDVITIKKDGTVLLNGALQGDCQMELM